MKHQRRGDGVCPRCKQPVDGGGFGLAPAGGGFAPAAIAPPIPVPHSAVEDSTGLGAKMAGAVFIANMLVGILAIAKLGMKGAPPPVSLIIDAMLGWKLLNGDEKAKGWSTGRVILGAIVFGALNFYRGQPADAVTQLCFSGALLGLLLGDPGKVRAWVSLAVAGGVLLLTVIGLMVLDPAALQ